jgi:hypothetical protein
VCLLIEFTTGARGQRQDLGHAGLVANQSALAIQTEWSTQKHQTFAHLDQHLFLLIIPTFENLGAETWKNIGIGFAGV